MTTITMPEFKVNPLSVRPSDPVPYGKMRVFDNNGRWTDIDKRENGDPPIIEARLITPQMALFILENYSMPNRTSRRHRVIKYKTAMIKGYWNTVNPIHFDNNGMLRDGYHRLKACVQANIPITFLVYFGITETELLSLDEGCSRSTRDVANIRGLKVGYAPLSAISYLLEYAGIKKTTPREDEGVFQDKHIVAANWVCDRLKKKPYSTNVVAAVCLRAYYSCYNDIAKLNRLEEFINIIQGVTYAKGDEDTAATAFMQHILLTEKRSGSDRERIMNAGCYIVDRFLRYAPTLQVRKGNPVKLFPLPEELENDGKIVI